MTEGGQDHPGMVGRDTNIGTFRDSLKSPIHRWFSYPVGFSPKLVESAIAESGLAKGSYFFDPFAGTATSLIVARLHGLESYGMEAHPFIKFIGSTKLRWEADTNLRRNGECLIESVQLAAVDAPDLDPMVLPKLLVKCYEPCQLRQLIAIRDHILSSCAEGSLLRALGELALAAIARPAASVSTGWPNVSPKRTHLRAAPGATVLFAERMRLMIADLESVMLQRNWPEAHLDCADARLRHPYLPSGSMDIVVTSAPYLNNFDYADRTRLETYLLGHYSNWRELTTEVRRHLIISATPQFDRMRTDIDRLLLPIAVVDTAIWKEIHKLVERIANERQALQGKKRFDLVAAGYFRDMMLALVEIRRVMRPNARMHIVLGDSALFGVHVPTDELVARLAVATGFKSHNIEPLRVRGTKWLAVRRSPHIPLRESLVTLTA